MMDFQLSPCFDGHEWKCARCGATLAKVVEAEKLTFPRMQKQIVTALELSAGYIHRASLDKWIKPRKLLPFQRGAQNRAVRQKSNDFTKWQLEVAQRKNDFASISQAQSKLSKSDEIKAKPSTPIPDETKPVQIFADGLPVSIECANEQCKAVSRLVSIRGAIMRPNKTQGHTKSEATC